MKDEENKRERVVQFRIENPITFHKFGVELGENRWINPDIYYFDGIVDLEIAIEKLVDLRERFLNDCI